MISETRETRETEPYKCLFYGLFKGCRVATELQPIATGLQGLQGLHRLQRFQKFQEVLSMKILKVLIWCLCLMALYSKPVAFLLRVGRR